MDRKAVIEECIEQGREMLTKMQKKLIDRQDGDSQFNGLGKILKGVQLHIADEMVTKGLMRGKGASMIEAGAKLLTHE